MHAVLLATFLFGAGGCAGEPEVAKATPASGVTAPTAETTPKAESSHPANESAEATPEPSPEAQVGSSGPGATVRIFFSPESNPTCANVTPVRRDVPDTRAIATAALHELFKGPTAQEEARGLGSFFGPDTTGLLRSVHVTDGVAYVDLDDITHINNVSTSCGSSMFLAQMDATLKQFPTVRQTVYAMEGDPEAFYTFLQRVCPDLLLDAEGNCTSGPF